MAKINSRGLYIADPHFTDSSIPNRKDNFLDSLSSKFQNALEIARDKELDYFVILGDLFHSPDPSGTVRNRVINILLSGNDSKRWPFDIFLTIGNHDIFGHNIKTIDKTAIKTLESVNLIKICNKSDKYGIHFGHYKHNIESEKIDVDSPIIAIHANIVPNNFYNSVLIEDFHVNEKNRVVISGHYHPGYSLISHNEVYFANPGSFGRISTTDSKHEIQACIIELKNNDLENIEYIPIPNAKKSSFVFDLEVIQDKKINKIEIKDFIDTINEAKIVISNESDVIQMIKDFGEAAKIDEKIVNEAVKRVNNQKPMEENDEWI